MQISGEYIHNIHYLVYLLSICIGPIHFYYVTLVVDDEAAQLAQELVGCPPRGHFTLKYFLLQLLLQLIHFSSRACKVPETGLEAAPHCNLALQPPLCLDPIVANGSALIFTDDLPHLIYVGIVEGGTRRYLRFPPITPRAYLRCPPICVLYLSQFYH